MSKLYALFLLLVAVLTVLDVGLLMLGLVLMLWG